MLSLFVIISLVSTIFFGIVTAIMDKKERNSGESYLTIALCSGIAFILLRLALGTCINDVVGEEREIDQRIAMYEEENEKIEANIDAIVSNYMDFESSTYEKLKNQNAIDLVSTFPELKSDKFVQKQIEVYIANNDQMKKLKEKKIELSSKKWHLYFGK